MQPRVAWLAVPGAAAGTAYVDADCRPPQVSFGVPDDETTVGTLQRVVLPDAGLTGPVLDCFLAAPANWPPETVVPLLAEVEQQPPGWTPPPGWRAIPVDEARFDGPDGLRHRFARWVAEQLGAPPDPLAPPWSRAGWHGRVTQWMDEVLADAGHTRVGDVEQVRAWGISAVLRTHSDDGRRWWFKAVCEHFRPEVPITATLHRSAPGLVPAVVAADDADGWLLLGDVAAGPVPAVTGEPASHASAFAALRALQDAVAERTGDLVGSGVASRPLTELADQLDDALADPELQHWHGASPERVDQLVAWVGTQVDRIAELALPDVLVHGDFHPGNVAKVGDDRRVVFDWSDAAFAPPFVDVATWLSWLEDDEPAAEAVWRSFAAQWTDVLPVDGWLAWRPVLEGVAGAYHTVSYVGIVRSLDELRRAEHGGGIREFFAMLDRAVPVGGASDAS